MLEQATHEKLRQLKLFGMLDGLEHIQKTQALQTLSFAEGLGLLVDHETNYKESKRLQSLIKSAKLRYGQAMIEDINYEHKREISREQFQWLIGGQWLMNHQNIIFIGPTGLGKSYLACACAQLACRKGITARYFRMSKLLEGLRIAHADGSYSRFLGQLLKTKCLVLDDWGLDAITPERRSDLLEIIDDQYDKRSVIIATQLPIEKWHDYIGDHTIADALLDRVVHQATLFKLEGDSMRKKLA